MQVCDDCGSWGVEEDGSWSYRTDVSGRGGRRLRHPGLR